MIFQENILSANKNSKIKNIIWISASTIVILRIIHCAWITKKLISGSQIYIFGTQKKTLLHTCSKSDI